MTNSNQKFFDIQEPLALDEMDEATFNAMMERGLREAKEDKAYPANEVFERLKARINTKCEVD